MKETCEVCQAEPVLTHLPIRLSIDCATSTYVSCHAQLAIGQDCIDRLGDDPVLNSKALHSATNIIYDRVAKY